MYDPYYETMVFRMNGGHHICGFDDIYKRIEEDAPSEEIVHHLRTHRMVDWEVGGGTGGDYDAHGERCQFLTYYFDYEEIRDHLMSRGRLLKTRSLCLDRIVS